MNAAGVAAAVVGGAVLAVGGAVTATSIGSSSPSAKAVLATAADADYTGYCGVEFHAIKDLQDGFVPGNPVDSSVDALGKLPVDANVTNTSRTRSPTEHNVYRVEATLVGTKGEADSDIHMLLKDPVTGATMNAEIPAGPCLAGSADAPQIEAARAALIAAYGVPPTSSYSTLNACVDVTGVAFFDLPHGQTDRAQNTIELHPVLAVMPCGSSPPQPPVTTGAQPPDTGPVTTTAPVVTATTTATVGRGCTRWPGRHYYYGRWHRDCRYYYFTTP